MRSATTSGGWLGQLERLMNCLPNHERRDTRLVSQLASQPFRTDWPELYLVPKIGHLGDCLGIDPFAEIGLLVQHVAELLGVPSSAREPFRNCLLDGFGDGGRYVQCHAEAVAQRKKAEESVAGDFLPLTVQIEHWWRPEDVPAWDVHIPLSIVDLACLSLGESGFLSSVRKAGCGGIAATLDRYWHVKMGDWTDRLGFSLWPDHVALDCIPAPDWRSCPTSVGYLHPVVSTLGVPA